MINSGSNTNNNNSSSNVNALLHKYIVKMYVCDVVEIDRRDIAYWCEKASFQKKEIPELISILEGISACMTDEKYELTQAKMFEFSTALFSRPNVIFYKNKTLSIWDGKTGRVVIDNVIELDNLISLLNSVLCD